VEDRLRLPARDMQLQWLFSIPLKPRTSDAQAGDRCRYGHFDPLRVRPDAEKIAFDPAEILVSRDVGQICPPDIAKIVDVLRKASEQVHSIADVLVMPDGNDRLPQYRGEQNRVVARLGQSKAGENRRPPNDVAGL